jgi:hypothetical protein
MPTEKSTSVAGLHGAESAPNGRPAANRSRSRPFSRGNLNGTQRIQTRNRIQRRHRTDILCGANTGSAVCDKYKPPFKFTGTLYSATLDVSGEAIRDTEAEMRVHMAPVDTSRIKKSTQQRENI